MSIFNFLKPKKESVKIETSKQVITGPASTGGVITSDSTKNNQNVSTTTTTSSSGKVTTVVKKSGGGGGSSKSSGSSNNVISNIQANQSNNTFNQVVNQPRANTISSQVSSQQSKSNLNSNNPFITNISGKVLSPPPNKFGYLSGTQSKSPPLKDLGNYPFSFDPVIYQQQKGTFTDKNTGQTVPIFETRYYGGLDGVKSGFVEDRPATQEEYDIFKSNTNILQTSDSARQDSVFGKSSELFQLGKSTVYQADKTASETLTRYGFGDETIGVISKASPVLFPYLSTNKKGRDFVEGATKGILTQARDKPVTTTAIFGLSYGAGFASKGIVTGLSVIPKVGGVAGTVGQTGLTLGGTALGLGYAGAIGASAVSTGDFKEAGEVIGRESVYGFAIGKGFGSGVRGFSKARGVFSTLGRKELKVLQGEYPQAPTSKQLDLFDKNVYKELSDKPGAFHTTSEKFWKSGTISAKEGASELPGIYASTQVSTPFARIAGSNSAGKINWKSLFVPEGKPGVAFLVPKGFRSSSVGFSNVKLFEGQKPTGNRGFAFFKDPVRKGYADVPGIKSEIETIIRPGSGNYLFESGKYYVNIKGTRVPVDVFTTGEGKVIKVGSGKIADIAGNKAIGGMRSYSLPASRVSVPIISSPIKNVISSSAKSARSSLARSYRTTSSVIYSTVSRNYLGSSSNAGSSRTGSSSRIFGSSSSLSSLGSSRAGSSILSSSILGRRPNIPIIPKREGAVNLGKSRMQIRRQPTRYTPSITGLVLGLKLPKTPSEILKGQGYSPFQLRGRVLNDPFKRRISRRKKRR